MVGEAEAQVTLRDNYEQAFEDVTPSGDTGAVSNAQPATVPAAAPAAPAAAAPDERARDDKGRFKEGKEVAPAQAPAAPPAVVAPAAALARPSSWKKEMWPLWEKLAQGLPLTPEESRQKAEYILQRENEAAKGVSTYKREWDTAKPILDAITPYQQILQARNIRPEQWIQNMATAEHALIHGAPEQKLSMFLKLAQDYQIPLQQLFQQGHDGKVYFNPQVQAYQPPQQPQRQAQQPDVHQVVQQVLSQEKAQQALAEFEGSAAEKYPHYEALRETMAQLLDAGLAGNLETAYDAALNLPQHRELAAQAQQAKAEADRLAAAEKAKAEAQRARSQAVSPRSSTPAQAAAASKKGLRSAYEESLSDAERRV